MLRLIGTNKENNGVNLVHICANLYTPDYQINPLSYLKAGMILWVNRGTTYDVYELTQARNKMTESDEEFIGRIMQVLNV